MEEEEKQKIRNLISNPNLLRVERMRLKNDWPTEKLKNEIASKFMSRENNFPAPHTANEFLHFGQCLSFRNLAKTFSGRKRVLNLQNC